MKHRCVCIRGIWGGCVTRLAGGFGLVLACLWAVWVAGCAAAATGDEPRNSSVSPDLLGKRAAKLFARDNLVAWCIVPFDAAQRTPEQRVQMLQELGLSACAYDWRDEHVPSFEREVQAYQAGGIRFFAFWAWHESAATLFQKHDLHPQFWVMLSDPGEMPEAQRVAEAADRLLPLAQRTQELECPLSLYNHGGWAGQPETMIQVCRNLHDRGFPHVGIAYNFHHAHDRIADWPEIFPRLKPYLHCLNLNGMNDDARPKILPIGQGQHERDMIRVILEHDYRGPIGILDHLEEVDSRLALQANLDGLAGLTAEFAAQSAADEPAPLPGRELFADAIPAEPNRAFATRLAERAAELGDPVRGARVFADPRFACLSCHRVEDVGGRVGPDLARVAQPRTGPELAMSLLWPQHEVDPAYAVWQALTIDGQVLSGYRRDLSEHRIGFANTSTLEMTEVDRDDLDELQPLGSPMPDGLAQSMSSLQRLDLLQYLLSIQGTGPTHSEFLAEAYRRTQTHQLTPEPTDVARGPLRAEQWPNATHPVNRDRIYDFYKKQAWLYRQSSVPPLLLGYFHSLDGPATGHWGNQDEAVWASDRWNHTALDWLQSGVFRGDGLTVPRGICVQLGEDRTLAACFDPESLTYPLVWRDGFVSFSSVRHGFMDGLRLAGQVIERQVGSRPAEPFEYLGFYRSGPRVVFAYRVAGVLYLDSPWVEGERFIRTVAPADEHPLRHVLSGGEGRNPERIATAIRLGAGSPYAVDTIELPIDNPWRALLFCSGHDFLPDGTGYVCTMQGDVWHVSGLVNAGEGATAVWRRYATGLHQPLGLVVVDGVPHAICRDQLVALHDLNGDGEADFYQCVNRQFLTSSGGHDYICGLERDAAGNFYTASSNQGLLRLSADGRSAEVVATGFRNPDGLGLMPDGTLTVPCSEGDWTPASLIAAIPPQRLAGTGAQSEPSDMRLGRVAPPHFGYPGPRDGQLPALPWLYLPRGVDNSAGGQLWVTSDQWGPLRDQMLHFSFGSGSHFLLLQDRIEHPNPDLPVWIQGAVVPLVGDFLSGAHRGRFNPVDGQLYVTGMNGWGTYTPGDGCFQRVRYTGHSVLLPIAIKIHADGVWLKFTQPLDAEVVRDRATHFAQAWNYRYSSSYGSPEFAVSHPDTPGHDWVAITDVSVSPSGDELFVQMPDLQPVNQLHLNLCLTAEAQREPGLTTDLFVTIHHLAEPFSRWPVPQFGPKLLTGHPIFADWARQLDRAPNPWLAELPGATPVTMVTGENLSFQTPHLEVQAGQTVRLTLQNADSVPHNWVLLQPDSLGRVGQLANQLLADPTAGQKQYVPASDAVICYTDVIGPGQDFTIYFQAPELPGRYPFLCTFPGHWMVMNGLLHVKPAR